MQEDKPTIPIRIFCAYAHQDEALRLQLEKHLAILKRQELITIWQSCEITAGTAWKQEIATHLDEADIILLLVSSDFMASDFIYNVAMEVALDRHYFAMARVIPIILRPVDWKHAPFNNLQVLPKKGKPITSWSGKNGRDKAFLEVVEGIRDVVTALKVFWSRPQSIYRRTPRLASSRDLDEAIATLQCDRANIFYERQNYEEALALYEEALRFNPYNHFAVQGKRDALQHLDDQQPES